MLPPYTSTSILTPGNHSITATYVGDANFAGSSTVTPLPQAVQPETTSTYLTPSANPSFVGAPVTYTATVVGGPDTPTGNVTLEWTGNDDTAESQTKPLTAVPNTHSATALFDPISDLPLGSDTITAVYDPVSPFADSQVTQTQTVNDLPSFTGISPDTGTSTNDQLTDTGVLQILGTAAPLASVTLSEEYVGVVDTVTADSTGHWVSNHFNSATTALSEGEAFFSATETLNGQTSAATAYWPVTVDVTPPEVTLDVPSTITSVNPQLTVDASDLNGLASPAAVTIQVYDSTGTTLLYTNSAAATLTDGTVTFALAYTLTPGTSYVLQAQVADLAGNVGTSAATPVSVADTVWGVNTTQALTSDPLTGDSLDQLGNVQRQHALDLGQSSDLALLTVNGSASENADQANAEVDVSLTPLQSPATSAALVYNSDSVSVRPVIQATLSSANASALPSQITAILTWNDGTPTTFTYSTAGSNPGDPLTISAEVPYAVATTGRYTWKLEVIAGPLDQTITGSTFRRGQ